MKKIRTGLVIAALGLAFTLALPISESSAGVCAKREIVATGSSTIAKMIAKFDAEMAWEIKAVKKYGPLWYSWWAARNNRFRCRSKGQRITCVARGTPCRLL